mmetsp:Transcript_81841/g.136817  ORF Transcript_81841/g.136817 Transcript_81841/m.136817 type:complete len:209 (+) Transcript_81841:152-778(+)
MHRRFAQALTTRRTVWNVLALGTALRRLWPIIVPRRLFMQASSSIFRKCELFVGSNFAGSISDLSIPQNFRSKLTPASANCTSGTPASGKALSSVTSGCALSTRGNPRKKSARLTCRAATSTRSTSSPGMTEPSCLEPCNASVPALAARSAVFCLFPACSRSHWAVRSRTCCRAWSCASMSLGVGNRLNACNAVTNRRFSWISSGEGG